MKKAIAKAPKKNGRPLAIIDEAKLVEMAAEDCTVNEIAAYFDVNPDTIYSRFSELLKKGRDKGNASIKRKLFEKAMIGDMSALIWLSKNRLGYKDKQPEEATQVHFNVYVNEVPKWDLL